MANTFSQIYVQVLFAVNGRLSLIRPEFKEELYKYMTGIVVAESLAGKKATALFRTGSQLGTVIRYIQNQERHHSRRTFRDEYLLCLKKLEVPFDDKYVFNLIE